MYKLIKILSKFVRMIKRNEADGMGFDGFWTEEELKQQQLSVEPPKRESEQNNHKEEIQLKVCPPSEIQKKSYSLHPDMATGWAPKVELPPPIPIVFDNERMDNLIRILLKNRQKTTKICYLGPRYENTYNAWYDKPFAFPYSHIKAPNNLKFTNRQFCGQHQNAEDGLVFDSFFQSGNLDCAIKVGESEYQLFLRVDSNTKGHLHWFNFKVKNLKKLQKYTIHICNFQKDRSLYSRGMKPYIYSSKKYLKKSIGWQQSGQNVKYESKSLKCTQGLNYDLPRMYKLSFEYISDYENDEIQMAYCIPYTYTRLVKFLSELSQNPNSKDIIQMSKLCTSLGGLEVPLLIVHEKQEEEKKESNLTTNAQIYRVASPEKIKGMKVPKKCIIISGRAHPGESNGSFMMEGFIEFICGNSKEAQNLRKNVVFKIIPMLNPDGVALGNYRTGVSGKDFNRQFRNPDKVIFPEVYSIKKLVTENKHIFKENLAMFLDFHGHSVRKNVFVYGPEFSIIQKFYYETRVFPKLLGNQTNMFRYYSCIFKVSEFKETTARAVVLRKLGVPFTYTIEASNGSYYDYKQLKDIPFQESSWKSMGKAIGETLYSYVGMLMTAQELRIKKEKQRNKESISVRRNFLKTTKPRGSRGFFNEPEIHSLILPGIEDEKIKLLFDEIKVAEQKKGECKVSDDELSQGDSDQEGEEDDLSPNKLNFLYTIIKNKTSHKSPEKMQEKFLAAHRFTTDEDYQQDTDNKSTGHENDEAVAETPPKFNEEIPIKKHSIQLQKRSFLYHSTNNNNILIIQPSPKREQTSAARMTINHSLYSRGKRRSLDERASKRINLVELGSTSTLNEEKRLHTGNLGRVLDLSDNFRNTCSYNIKYKDRERAQFTIDTVYQSAQLTRRPRRSEDYKIRKFGGRNHFF